MPEHVEHRHAANKLAELLREPSHDYTFSYNVFTMRLIAPSYNKRAVNDRIVNCLCDEENEDHEQVEKRCSWVDSFDRILFEELSQVLDRGNDHVEHDGVAGEYYSVAADNYAHIERVLLVMLAFVLRGAG